MWCANVRNLSTGRDLTTSHARFPVWALFPSVSAVYLERAVSKSGLVSEVTRDSLVNTAYLAL